MKKLHRPVKRKPKHVLVRIKNELGLSQAEIPESLGIALDTFKNIVHGRVKSWDEHAAKVSRATGITVESLLAYNPRKPLMAIDGKRWSAERNRIGIAARQWKDLVVERSQGRHTLQWFRILMIKVARCMLAAYHEKKSGDAFDRLNRAIGEVGRLYPTWSAKTEVWPKPGESCLRVGGKIVPIENWPSRDWDFTQQASVAALPSRSRKGVVKIFGSFVKAILAEERRQNKAAENDLITAEKRAREIQQISKGHFAKPPRR